MRSRSITWIALPLALGVAAAALLLAALAARPAQAAGTVGNGSPGSCTEAALLAALDGGGLVTFNCGPNPYTITLTARRLITADTTLDGGGKITLSGGGLNGIFAITATATVNLRNLVFYNGNGTDFDAGGAIANGGALVVSNTTFISNTAGYTLGGGDGGAIFSTGRLTLTNSAFYANTAEDGGAVYAEPSLGEVHVYIAASVFQGNRAADAGGAVLAVQHLQIEGSEFFDNRADISGGAIYADGVFTLTNSVVYSNTAALDYGGGIYAEVGPTSLYNVDIYSNVAGYEGGGVYAEDAILVEHVRFFNNFADQALGGYGSSYGGGLGLYTGPATLRHVQLYGNRADTGGGGLINQAQLTADDVDIHHNTVLGPGGWGGGADMDTSNAYPITLNNLRVWANTVISGHADYAGGGLSFYYSPITLTNSAIFSNTVVEGSGGGGLHASYGATVTVINTAIYSNVVLDGRGGGLEASNVGGDTHVQLINTTLSGNAAPEGGAVYNAPLNLTLLMTNTTVVSNTSGAGGVLTGAVTLKNSLVAFNAPANCGGGVTSNGHNLENADTCGLASTGDAPNTNPLIAPLAANGAANPFNLTHALRDGSPAIDTADNAACRADDQRGGTRPLDGDGAGGAVCDKGAFEYGNLLFDLFMPFLRRS